MNLESTAFHIFGALGRAIGRVILWFLGFLIIGFAAVEAVSKFAFNHPATLLVHIGAVALGLVLGYAAALTVIVREVVTVLVDVFREVQKVAKGGETDIGKFAQTIEATISGRR